MLRRRQHGLVFLGACEMAVKVVLSLLVILMIQLHLARCALLSRRGTILHPSEPDATEVTEPEPPFPPFDCPVLPVPPPAHNVNELRPGVSR